MTGFECNKLFIALNNHFFQNKYDYFEYHGAVNVKPETYDAKRSDEKHRYDRLARKFPDKEDLENFIVANLLESSKRAWIGTLFGGEADDRYTRWQSRTQAIQYNLVNEISGLLDNHSFNDLFKCDANSHPAILKAHLRGDVSLESFVVLDICLNFIPKIDEKLGDDRSWMGVRNKALKYRPFLERLNIDVGKLSKAIQQAVKELGSTQ
jgi:T4 gene Gp59 loader of gp41 DNA helicase C-term